MFGKKKKNQDKPVSLNDLMEHWLVANDQEVDKALMELYGFEESEAQAQAKTINYVSLMF